ncbi:MAG: hypothetical protein ABIC91_04150 [Nanoarchaeota archaeon]|nr:hypothetical protein [Nanoarchaeota archaeon]
MTRGRPVGSNIRQNIVEILYFLKKAHGYKIFKIYRELFPKTSQRVIYYHLKKGSDLDEFKVSEVKKETGDYSWGDKAEKIYYSLGKNARPKVPKEVHDYFAKKKIEKATKT